MRLAIFIGSLIALILVSRWYTLSEKPEPAEVNNEVANSPVTDSLIFDPAIAPAAFDQFSPLAAKAKWLGAATTDSSAAKRLDRNRFENTLGAKAKNATELIRAEYEVPQQAGKVLMELESDTVLEIKELPCEDPGMVRIEVTTNWQGQEAMCNFVAAFFPTERLERLQNSPVEESYEENQIRSQMRAMSVAVD